MTNDVLTELPKLDRQIITIINTGLRRGSLIIMAGKLRES